MTKVNQLTIGSTVIFSKIPLGSWLSANTLYTVEANGGKTVHFRNLATGSGTYDEAWQIARSEFTVLPAQMAA